MGSLHFAILGAWDLGLLQPLSTEPNYSPWKGEGREGRSRPSALPALTQGSQHGHSHDEQHGEDIEDFDGHLQGQVLLALAAATPCPA